MKSLILAALLLASTSAFANVRGGSELIWCKSSSYRYNECRTYNVRRIDDVRVYRQRSKSACVPNHTYGVNHGRFGDVIWVDRGCEADFLVYGR